MTLIETFMELDKLYEANLSISESKSMPYALLVLLNNTWKVYKGLNSNLSDQELSEFLTDKPEYTEAKVVPSADIYKYINKTAEVTNESISRVELIKQLKALGKNYYFDTYTDEQLYRIWEKAVAKNEEQEAIKDLYTSKVDKPTCVDCGRRLSDDGSCPTCDHGEEELEEGIFDGSSKRSGWVTMTPASLTQSTKVPTPQQVVQNTSFPQVNTSGGHVVTIVHDGNKLRARADDGKHGEANVAFPNALRNHVGQKYEVENLIWNGKNYRATGRIAPI